MKALLLTVAVAATVFAQPGPSPLSETGLVNLEAFARLYGYVRYFYPGDEAAGADWERVAIEGVRAVEGARDPAELAARLRDVFGPLAPEARIGSWSEDRNPSGEPPVKVVQWAHHGLGMSDNNIYRSRRVIDTQTVTPTPIRATLGGVKVEVPYALVTEQDAIAPPKTPDDARATAGDRATRLAGVIIAWNIFQHFYPYFDVVRTDWPAELTRALRSAATDSDEAEYLTTLRLLVAALHDGHGGVIGPGQSSQSRLPLVVDWIDGKVLVTAVAEGVQGISPGDAIAAVGGDSAAVELSRRERLISSATPQWRRYLALQQFGSGEAGKVALTIELRVGETRKVEVARVLARPDEKRTAHLSEVAPGIFYIDINRLTWEQWTGSLEKFAKAKGLVIDFRGYPGQLRNPAGFFGSFADAPMTSAQWHIPDVSAPDHVNMMFSRGGEWKIPPHPIQIKAKRAFITDGRAISYAESCMGIVEHYKLGEIVGAPTAGTNGNINPFDLPGGYRVTWTGMKVLKHDGTQHHGIGIRPTIPVERTRAGVAAGRDEFLERAIEAVR